MKPQFENIPSNAQTSFGVKFFHLDKFTVPYHYHPAYELTLILKGNGKRYVGRHMEGFVDGDLILLGSDLPHCWKSEGPFSPEDYVEAIVVQFEPNFLGAEFFERPEMIPIQELLKKSRFGIHFHPSLSETLTPMLLKLWNEANPFQKLSQLLQLLNLLATSDHYTLLDYSAQPPQQQHVGQERINTALGYIVDNFREEILLETVAVRVNMSPNAFCKYFKKTTGKTFIETVIEYRINFAVQQLLSSDRAISEIAFDCGFGDISHFHKRFKKTFKMSPLRYRQSFQAHVK